MIEGLDDRYAPFGPEEDVEIDLEPQPQALPVPAAVAADKPKEDWKRSGEREFEGFVNPAYAANARVSQQEAEVAATSFLPPLTVTSTG